MSTTPKKRSTIVSRIDRIRGISPEQRERIRLNREWERQMARAAGPSHRDEINAIFSRGMDSTSTR